MGSDIEGTFILFYFVYLSIHGELPLQTAYMQSNAEATSVGAAEVSTYNKNHPDEGISEMCDCCTSCTARLPWHWNTKSGAAKRLQQPGRFPHSPERKKN